MAVRKLTLYLQLLLRRLSNPVFLFLLLLSTGLWYATKLSYTYTTEINIPLRIDDASYSVRCTVEGVGYQILLHKIAPRRHTIVLSTEYVEVIPSAASPGQYDVSSYYLQNVISKKIATLRILSIDSPVELTIPAHKP